MEVPVPFLGSKSIMKGLIKWIDLFIELVFVGIRFENPGLQPCHCLLGIGEAVVPSCSGSCAYCARDSRAQSTRLTGSAHHHRPARDIGINLHHKRILLRDAAAIDDLLDGDPILFETINDRQGPECGRFHERPVDLRGCCIKSLSHEKSCELLVDQNSPISIVPVERKEPRLPRLQFRRSSRKRFVRSLLPVRAHVLHKPIENIPHCRLARLQPEIVRKNTSVHDAAQPRNVL